MTFNHENVAQDAPDCVRAWFWFQIRVTLDPETAVKCEVNSAVITPAAGQHLFSFSVFDK